MTTAIVEVEDKDGGKAMRKLLRELGAMDDHHVVAGVVAENDEGNALNAFSLMWDDEKNPEPGWTIGQNAIFHHSGGRSGQGFNVPARPYVSKGFDKYLLNIEKQVEQSVQEVFDGKRTAKKALASIGKHIRSWQRTILDLKDLAPLSAIRLQQKRAIGTPDNPLINWRRMYKATSYKVRFGD